MLFFVFSSGVQRLSNFFITLVNNQQTNMLMNLRILSLIYFLLGSCFIQAQTKTKTLIKEIWYDKTPVSGDIRVGIISEFDTTNLPLDTFYYAYVPDEPIEGLKLCTVISSRDGRYKGELITDLNEDMRGTISGIDWKSEHFEDLAAMKKNDITILSMVAETCDSDPKFYTLSQWSKSKTDSIYIILNSEKKPKIKIKSDGIKKCNCKELAGETNVNFNYKCSIPISYLKDKFEMDVVQTVIRLSNVTSVKYPIVGLKVPQSE